MRRSVRSSIPLLYLVGLLAAASCGRVGPIRPPELVSPKPPAELSVMNAAEGLQIRFRRPTETVDGMDMPDLAYLELWRTCLPNLPRQRIAKFPVVDRGTMRKPKWSEITDRQPAEGNTCSYEVVAETWDGYRSEPIRTLPILRKIPTSAPSAP
jgi:hypothetical protein